MGQAGSQPAAAGPQRARRGDPLPHEPLRLAPKVLPSLPESPCLRSTDNGAILHSGGTISGRRPASGLQESWRSHRFGQPNAYRSRSGGGGGGAEETRSRERDPLHRSYTNLGYRNNDNGSLNKRFGSEPDLRIEEQQKQKSNNKHFRKKYRAPPPPSNHRYGSSPDSSLGKARPEPQRKLRLFKTRNETKKTNGHPDSKIPTYRNTYTDFKSLDLNDQSFERRYKSPCKSKDQHLKYPDNKDMMQSSVSLKREERLLQEARRVRTDVVSGCRAKTSKSNDQSEAWKTPLLIRNFRYSERFKKDDSDHPSLRREKTFDNSLIEHDRDNDGPNKIFEKGIKTVGDQKNGKVSALADRNQPLRKSLPSLLPRNEEKDEFQTELKKATNRIRNELGNKVNLSESKTSQLNKFSIEKSNPTKITVQAKVKESSLKRGVASTKPDAQITNNRRPLMRTQDVNSKSIPQSNKNNEINKFKMNAKENNKPMPDRGQASGKESTPEHSPNRKRDTATNNSQQKQKSAPSKQFYFGMIESEQSKPRDHTKDFPGLGCPIIEEFDNFHLIEQKLLSYREEDDFEKFNKEFRDDCKLRIVSSESAVSSEGSSLSERSPAAGRRGAGAGTGAGARRSSPPPARRASPNTAWRHLVSVMDSYIKSDTEPLAVETKISADISAESSPRSDPSADKSGDSGISGDHAHSDHRLDSPTRQHLPEPVGANWTPQQDLGDSSSEGAGGGGGGGGGALGELGAPGPPTYSPGAQPFSLSLPRELHDKNKQLQQGFHSLQKFRKSVSGALGAALGARRFDIEHEPMLEEPQQNWFLTKSAPNSLSNPLLFQPHDYDDVKEDVKEKEVQSGSWRAGTSYMSWGGHVMYLPPAPPAHPAAAPASAAPPQPLSLLGPLDRPIRSKSSGCLEASARSARAARAALAGEMRERERSASPELARAVPAAVRPVPDRNQSSGVGAGSRSGGKRFAFQSTVRRRERRRVAERLARDAELREQQRRTELEAMRRVEEEFQRKRAREKASIRQQLRLVSSGAASLPTPTHNKGRDEPEGCSRGEGVAGERVREATRARHSNPASDTGSRSKSSTPIRCVELSEWRTGPPARVYRDWAAAPVLAHTHAHAHPPACANITHAHGVESEAFSGSPRSDNYRLEFARGRSPRSPPPPRPPRSPRTPRAPRLLPAPASPSSSGSELSLRALRVRESGEETEESPLASKLTSGPARASIAIR